MLAIRLPCDMEALAKATGRTKTYYARTRVKPSWSQILSATPDQFGQVLHSEPASAILKRA